MPRMIRLPIVAGRPFGCTLALSLLWASPVWLPALTASAASSEIADTRALIQEWVKVKALISEEREEWAMDKAMLTDTIDLLVQEKALLEGQIAQREEAAAAADSERAALSQRRESLEASAARMSEQIANYESQVVAWVPSLPAILQEELQPLIRRLPAEGVNIEQAGLARRLQSVVGILSMADKFNSTLSFRSEIRTDPETGESRETDTLFIGLALAVYSDAQGSIAGVGVPTESGWEWTPAPDAATRIAHLMAIYKKEQPAAYVGIPLQVK